MCFAFVTSLGCLGLTVQNNVLILEDFIVHVHLLKGESFSVLELNLSLRRVQICYTATSFKVNHGSIYKSHKCDAET